MSNNYNPQPPRISLSSYTILDLNVKHPLMTVWWAASFAGFGQMFVSSYVKGYLLFLLEIIVNMRAKLNLAIIYSFTGRFEQAKEVAAPRRLLAYALIYVYNLWDAYNQTVNLNKQAVPTAREKTSIVVFKMQAFGVNYWTTKALV